MPRNAFNPNAVDDLPLFGHRREPETGAEEAASVSPRALLARDRAIESLSRHSGEEFLQAAATFVLEQLAGGTEKTSEQLVDACKAAGIKPHDDRAFGPVIARLARRGKIQKVRHAQREKGHGTSGGNVWRAAK
jgi:hypothetical protein